MSYKGGYAVRELSIDTGGYAELFAIPFYRTFPEYDKLDSCGIHPDDWIIYCIMRVDGTWYIVRTDRDMVEFVAKLKKQSDINGQYSAATFGPSGTFYYMHMGPATVYTIRDVVDMKGYSDQNAGGLADLSTASGSTYASWGHIDDIVAVAADIDGSGEEVEYLISYIGDKLVVVKATGAETDYKGWIVPASGTYAGGWGAGWTYNGEVFFANNDGLGVYTIPLGQIDLESNTKVTVKHVGPSNPTANNDALNCIDSPVPWLTKCKTSYHEVFADDRGECPWGAVRKG